jgi:hypothetical protein
VRALAETGQDVSHAASWPNGGVRWRAAHDKKGYESIAPISRETRAAIDAYLRRYPMTGTAPLFPALSNPTWPVTKETATDWLRRAERLADVPHMARGAWHPFRRLWASERRGLAATDVMAAGGWRSLEVMRTSYMHADGAGLQSVVDNGLDNAPSGLTLDTPASEAVAGQ